MRVVEINAKSIISRMRDGFFAMRYLPFRLTANIYRGCTHGCVYCYAACTHYYMRSSPNLFSKEIYVKKNAAEIFETEIIKYDKRKKKSVIVIGNISDTYQPIEVNYRLTRRLLEICYEYDFPCFIETKSPLILNDIDIIEKLAERDLIGVGMTVTSYDNHFTKLVEPFVPRSKVVYSQNRQKERILTLKKLSEIGVDTYLHITPYFPHITDKDIDSIIRDAAEADIGNVIMAPLELSGFIWSKLKRVLAVSEKYSYLIPLYEKMYFVNGQKLGARTTISEKDRYMLEKKVSELCKSYGIGYWAFTNPQFNTAIISGVYKLRYPILLDYWKLAHENGELRLKDAINFAMKFPIDKKYLSIRS
jgi:DNA repair photolyase